MQTMRLPHPVTPLFDTIDDSAPSAVPRTDTASDVPDATFTLPNTPRAARAALADLARAGTAEALRHLRDVVLDPTIPSQQRIQAAVALLNRGFADAERVSSVGIDINVSRVDPATLSTADIAARLRDIQATLSRGHGTGRVVDVLDVRDEGAGAAAAAPRAADSN